MNVNRERTHLSCPLVEGVVGLYSLEPPEVGLVQRQGLGVSPAEALSHPCVVQALSVSEPHVAGPPTDGGAEEHARPGEHYACVEGSWVQPCALSVVPVAERCSCEGAVEPGVAAEDLEAALDILKAHVEEVGVVLDELDGPDPGGQVGVGLVDCVWIRLLMSLAMVIVTHIYYSFILLLIKII